MSIGLFTIFTLPIMHLGKKSPKFAWALFSISPGYWNRSKRNARQFICTISKFGGQTRCISGSVKMVFIVAKTDTLLRWASYLWLDHSFFLTPLSWVLRARAPLRKSKKLYLEDATSINWTLLVQKQINGKTVTWSGTNFMRALLTRIRVTFHSKITCRSLKQLEYKNFRRLEELTSVLLKKGGASLR